MHLKCLYVSTYLIHYVFSKGFDKVSDMKSDHPLNASSLKNVRSQAAFFTEVSPLKVSTRQSMDFDTVSMNIAHPNVNQIYNE